MWDRASVDATSVPASAGGEHTGRNPTDRGKLGCKHHLLVDQRGLLVVAQLSAAQVPIRVIPLVEPIPVVKGLSGNARRRPGKLHADRAYASRAPQAWVRRRASRHELRATAWTHAQGSVDGAGSLRGLSVASPLPTTSHPA